MAITTSLKRSKLRLAWKAAERKNPANPDLLSEFEANMELLDSVTKAGSFASVAGNNRSTTYALSSFGTATPIEIQEYWSDMIDLFDLTLASLQETEENPTHEDVKTKMLADGLYPVTSVRSDFSDLRIA